MRTVLIATAACLVMVPFLQAAFNFPDYLDHPCRRECQDGGEAMTCEYHWILEYYYTLSKACYNCPYNLTDCSRQHCIPADGVSRPVLVANRLLPGPGIHVCEGDTIVVNVTNKLAGAEATTIHWHGVLQKGTPYMDGVSMITQCPIPAHTTFTYRFKPKQPGTMFWHAHSGVQRSDGIFGALVIRQPPGSDPHGHLYDYDLPEHTIIVNDWLVELTIQKFAAHHHDDGDNKPRSALINGKGALEPYPDPVTEEHHFTPPAVFRVEKGKRYRFRVASNGVLNCPLQFSIQDHQLYMIATDGYPFQPIIVDSFNIFAGERYDFVLHADRDVDNYLVHVRGLADCGANFKQAKQHAILRYEGAGEEMVTRPEYNDGRRTGLKLNPWNRRGTPQLLPVATLYSVREDDITLKPVPDKQFYIAMDFNIIDNQNFHHPQFYSIFDVVKRQQLLTPQMNHISTIFPPSPPLGQWADLTEDMFCNEETVKLNCSAEYCQCVHRLQVALGDVVEIILVDEGVVFNANHPMHLHGHSFRILAMDRLGNSTSVEEVKRLDKEGGIRRKLHGAVVKDSVTVPDGGYTVLRFHANNPGFWLLHCHVEFHIEIGMGLVIQVGSYDQMPKPPPGFPRCGSWDGGHVYDTLQQTETTPADTTTFLTTTTTVDAVSQVTSSLSLDPPISELVRNKSVTPSTITREFPEEDDNDDDTKHPQIGDKKATKDTDEDEVPRRKENDDVENKLDAMWLRKELAKLRAGNGSDGLIAFKKQYFNLLCLGILHLLLLSTV